MFHKTQYAPLNLIQITAANLLSNYNYFSKYSKLANAPVLKSNAYGHGLRLVAKVLDTAKAPFFCVDSLYEAYELEKSRIRTPILVMGNVNPESLQTRHLPFSFVLSNTTALESFIQYQSHAPVHIFVDTGMNREGFGLDELSFVLKRLNEHSVKVEGLMSHFAAADQYASSLTISQLKNFEQAQRIVEQHKVKPKWVHISATSGILHAKDFKQFRIGNMVRLGIGLYGIDPEDKNKNLKPALRLSTTLSQIKHISKGEKVGYNFTFTAKNNRTIGVLPIGYNDGVDRRLSGVGSVMIGKTKCPIVGLISMNIMTIDITEVNKPTVGQAVTVFSNNKSDINSIQKSAVAAKTIPYELLVKLNPQSIKRVAV